MTTLPPFELHRVRSTAEASVLMDELGDEAALYAGGTELLLLMKLGFASFLHLVDIKPIEELGRLEVRSGHLVIGATVTHRTVERSPIVAQGWPDLVEMERRVANVRVRGTGSLGGNLAFADPHSDPATFLLAADVTLELGREDVRRRVPIDAFVLGPYSTALGPGELLIAIDVPPLAPGAAMSHVRFAFHERPAATLSAWVQAVDGRVVDARLAVGSVGLLPVLVPGVAEALAGSAPASLERERLSAIGEAAGRAAEPVSDSNGSDDYKAALVRTLAGRALTEAAARAARRAGPQAEAGA